MFFNGLKKFVTLVRKLLRGAGIEPMTYFTQRFFSFFKWYRKRDPFTIRNGPSQFPNGPFHN